MSPKNAVANPQIVARFCHRYESNFIKVVVDDQQAIHYEYCSMTPAALARSQASPPSGPTMATVGWDPDVTHFVAADYGCTPIGAPVSSRRELEELFTTAETRSQTLALSRVGIAVGMSISTFMLSRRFYLDPTMVNFQRAAGAEVGSMVVNRQLQHPQLDPNLYASRAELLNPQHLEAHGCIESSEPMALVRQTLLEALSGPRNSWDRRYARDPLVNAYHARVESPDVQGLMYLGQLGGHLLTEARQSFNRAVVERHPEATLMVCAATHFAICPSNEARSGSAVP